MSDWLTIIIAILIVGIVLDGIRRARNARKGEVRLSRNARKADQLLEKENDLGFHSEFPSGGARKRSEEHSRVSEGSAYMEEAFNISEESRKPSEAQENDYKTPQQASLQLDEPVPMLMEAVGEGADSDSSPSVTDASSNASAGSSVKQGYIEDEVNRVDDSQSLQNTSDEKASHGDPSEPSLGSLSDLDAIEEVPNSSYVEESLVQKKSTFRHAASLFSKEKSDDEAIVDNDTQESVSDSKKPAEKHENPFQKSDDNQGPKEIIVVNIMAPAGQQFLGDVLLNSLTECSLKYGDMGIFHRHKGNDGDAAVVYSLANIVEPGTFDLSSIGQSSTPGLCVFLSLPTACPAVEAYEDMIQTVRQLASLLGGELKDENRSALTNQTIEHGRQRVIEFERKNKLHK